MIRITSLRPLIKSAINTLQDLENGYPSIIATAKGKDPAKILQKAINDHTLYKVPVTGKKDAMLKAILSDYKTILTGSPTKLQRIIKRYDDHGYNNLCFQHGKATAFGKAVLKAFGYESRFRSVQQKGLWLSSILNIKVCPYCNSQYTLVVKQKEGRSLAKFQFDHFFSKDRYPYLSLSLYNLIPSCAACNHKKSNQQLSLRRHFHPYHNDLSDLARFKIKYPGGARKLSIKEALSMDLEDIKITFVSRYKESKNLVNTHNALYDIEHIYARHADVAHEILIKAMLYDKYYQKNALALRNVFPDRATLMRYILGNYLTKASMNDRPLSKFTVDIAKHLGLL